MSDELPEVGPWARDKLDRLRKYLRAYTAVLSKQSWVSGYVYVDAFAGSGRASVRGNNDLDRSNTMLDLGQEFRGDQEARQVLDGSPKVALDVEPPFTQYLFLERDQKRLAILQSLEREYENRRKIRISGNVRYVVGIE
jgi:three-Cys-motif partner protein